MTQKLLATLLVTVILLFSIAACSNANDENCSDELAADCTIIGNNYVLIPDEGMWTYTENARFNSVKDKCIIAGKVSDYDRWSGYYFVAIDGTIYVINHDSSFYELCEGHFITIDTNLYLTVTVCGNENIGPYNKTWYLPECFN